MAPVAAVTSTPTVTAASKTDNHLFKVDLLSAEPRSLGQEQAHVQRDLTVAQDDG